MGIFSETLKAIEEQRGLLGQAIGGANVAFGNIADIPQRLAFGEDFERIRELNPTSVETQLKRPEGTLEEIGNIAGRVAPELALEAAAIAGTGGVAAPALLGRTALAGGLSAGLGTGAEAAAEPETSFSEVATRAGIGFGIGLAAPFALKGIGGLGKRAIRRVFGEGQVDEVLEKTADEALTSPDPQMRENAIEALEASLRQARPSRIDPELPEEAVRDAARRVFKEQLQASVARDLGEEGAGRASKALTKLDNLDEAEKRIIEAHTSGMDAEDTLKFLEGAGDLAADTPLPIPRKRDVQNLVTFADKVRTLRASMMLSSIRTLGRNFSFTLQNQLLNRAAQAGAGALSAGARKVGLSAEQDVFMREGLEALSGFMGALPDALGQFAADTKITRELLDKPQAFRGLAGKVINAPFAALKWSDNVLFNMEFGAGIRALATRRMLQKFGPGLKGQPLQRAIDRQLKQWAEDVSQVKKFADFKALREVSEEAGKRLAPSDPAVLDAATRIAREFTTGIGDVNEARFLAERAIFVANEGRQLDQIISQWRQVDDKLQGGLSLFLPFVRTPANEAREFLRATPFDLLTKGAMRRMNDDMARGLAPDLARARAYQEVSKAILGTGIFAAVGWGLKSGLIDANPFRQTESAGKRAVENAAGVRQDMVRIGDTVVPLRNLGALGRTIKVMQVAAEETSENPEEAGRVEDMMQLVTLDIVAELSNETFARDAKEMLEVAFGDVPNKKRRFAEQLGGSFLPAALRDVESLRGSPITRPDPDEPSGTRAGAEARLGQGQPKLGLFGEELKREPPGRLGGIPGTEPISFLLGTESVAPDPIAQRMLDVGALHVPPRGTVPDVELTSDEETGVAKARGLAQRTLVERIMGPEGSARRARFDGLRPEIQKKLIDKQFTAAGRIINSRVRALKRRGMPLDSRMLLRGLN